MDFQLATQRPRRSLCWFPGRSGPLPASSFSSHESVAPGFAPLFYSTPACTDED